MSQQAHHQIRIGDGPAMTFRYQIIGRHELFIERDTNGREISPDNIKAADGRTAKTLFVVKKSIH